jgi:ketosteroid isomerase-like protein
MLAVGALGVMLAACNQAAAQDDEAQRVLTLLQDRIAIEDLLVDYYAELGSGSHQGFGRFFTEDAVFDVNGIVVRGHKEIQALYDRTPGAPAAAAAPGKEHVDYMHLTNPVIRVSGDTATAKLYWTGVVSDDVNAPPKFEEMGREYDQLVKVDGRWLIKKRVVIADAGMPVLMNNSWKRKRDYDITKDN